MTRLQKAIEVEKRARRMRERAEKFSSLVQNLYRLNFPPLLPEYAKMTEDEREALFSDNGDGPDMWDWQDEVYLSRRARLNRLCDRAAIHCTARFWPLREAQQERRAAEREANEIAEAENWVNYSI